MAVHFDGRTGPAETIIIDIENDFDFRSHEYRSLYEASDASGFQSPLWLDCFYKVLVPGVGASPLVLTARKGGQLAAVIPLVSTRVTGATVLQAADLGVADYNRIVCVPATVSELCESGVRDAIRRKIAFADILFLRKIDRGSRFFSQLFGSVARSACENDAHIIDLDSGAFENWRQQNLKKGFRKNIDRRRRKLEHEHDRVFWRDFAKEGEIDDALNFIRKERTKRFSNDILADSAYFEFYRACALAGAESGETITTGLVVDGRIVSADFGVMGKGCLHSILCAADIENFGAYAPGLQSLHDLIWERNNRGDTHFDAGLGNSRYKQDFAARDVPLDNLSVSLSLKGQAIAAVYHHAKPVKNLLRNIIRTVH